MTELIADLIKAYKDWSQGQAQDDHIIRILESIRIELSQQVNFDTLLNSKIDELANAPIATIDPEGKLIGVANLETRVDELVELFCLACGPDIKTLDDARKKLERMVG